MECSSYYLPPHVGLLANIPSAKLVVTNLFDGRVRPHAVAGFGFGFLWYSGGPIFGGSSAYDTAAMGRYGLGTDVQLSSPFVLRVDAIRMALNFTRWTTSWNVSGGLVFSFF